MLKMSDDELKALNGKSVDEIEEAIQKKNNLVETTNIKPLVRRVGTPPSNTFEIPISNVQKLHGAPKRGKPTTYIDDLANDMKVNGYKLNVTPIEGVKMSDGRVLIFDGHHRLAALEKLGEKSIPIRIQYYTEIPEEGIRLMLKIGEKSNFYKSSQYPSGYKIPDLGLSRNIEIDIQAQEFLDKFF